jgi:hypothetical protein
VLDRQRRVAIDRLMVDAQDVLRDSDAETLGRWYTDWIRRRNALRSWLISRQVPPVPADEQARELETSDLEQTALAERLRLTDRQAEAVGEAGKAYEPDDLWRLVSNPDRPTRRWIAPQQAQPPWLEVFAVPAATERRFPTAALALLCLALAVMPFLPNPGLGRVVGRAPQLLGLGLGLAWWLWLTPSALGCGIAGLSLLAWCLPALAGRRRPRSTGDATEKVAVPAA